MDLIQEIPRFFLDSHVAFPFDQPLAQHQMTDDSTPQNNDCHQLFFEHRVVNRKISKKYFQRMNIKKPPVPKTKTYSCVTRAISIHVPHQWNIEMRTMPTTTWLNLQLKYGGIRNDFWSNSESESTIHSICGYGSKFDMTVAQECVFDATNYQHIWVH